MSGGAGVVELYETDRGGLLMISVDGDGDAVWACEYDWAESPAWYAVQDYWALAWNGVDPLENPGEWPNAPDLPGVEDTAARSELVVSSAWDRGGGILDIGPVLADRLDSLGDFGRETALLFLGDWVMRICKTLDVRRCIGAEAILGDLKDYGY